MDISLSYQEKGSGKPFILLHGNGEDGTYFKKQIDYFSDRYKMYAIDTRGHDKKYPKCKVIHHSGRSFYCE